MNLPPIEDAHLKTIMGTFFETSFESIVITTAEPGYPIVYANPQFCKMTGYALEELKGQTPKIFQGEKTNPKILEKLKSCLDNGTYFHGATINYRKDGSWYPVEWNISPIKGEEGKPLYFLSIQKELSNLQKVFSRLKNTNEHFRKFLLDFTDSKDLQGMDRKLLEQQKTLVNDVLDDVALYNPALRSDDSLAHFEEGEFFDCSNDLYGVIADPLLTQNVKISAREYARKNGHRISVSDIRSILKELQDHLEFIPHSRTPSNELNELGVMLKELANLIFYLDEFVALSSVLNELALQTRECHADAVPEFIIDIFSALIRDLDGWVDSLFVAQSVDDIHYLDASMISSARQLMAFLK
jgi:PAS domain S-box-containing protein